MIEQKVFGLMNAAKERIIKAMQERGITKVNLVMTWEEFAKENGFDPTEEPDSDYDDYRNQEAPYVVYFNKWGNGIDYAVYSVELVDGPVNPRFKLQCYANEEGDDWFYDSDITRVSMIGVFDEIEKKLGLEEEPEKVYVFTAEQAWEDEVADIIVKTFHTREAAREFMHKFIHEDGDESIEDYVKRKGWEVETDEPDLYLAYDDGRYLSDHIEITITECNIE